MIQFRCGSNFTVLPTDGKTLNSGDERILETASLVNSPEFERLRENAKYETLNTESQEFQATQTPATAWSYRGSDTFFFF